MGLADRFARSGESAPAAPPEVTCLRYEPVAGTKRCKHYLKGGACSLPDEFMCVEWLKANGHHEQAGDRRPEAGGGGAHPTHEPLHLAAFSLQPPEAVPVRPRSAARSLREPEPVSAVRSRPEPESRTVPVIRNLSDADIASFKALKVEVCLTVEGSGEIWLVPEYTGRADRQELSARDAATLAAVCSAFPGARVTKVVKTSADESQ